MNVTVSEIQELQQQQVSRVNCSADAATDSLSISCTYQYCTHPQAPASHISPSSTYLGFFNLTCFIHVTVSWLLRGETTPGSYQEHVHPCAC